MHGYRVSPRERRLMGLIENRAFISASEHARMQGRTASGVHTVVRGMEDAPVGSEGALRPTLVESANMGFLLPRARRLYLSEHGQAVTNPAGNSWNQPGYLSLLADRIARTEAIPRVCADLTEIAGGLEDFQWVEGLGFEAAAKFERGFVVAFYSGFLETESEFAERIRKLGENLEQVAFEHPRPRPAMIVVLADGLWQVQLVTRVLDRYGMLDWARIVSIPEFEWYGSGQLKLGRGWIRQPAARRTMGRETFNRKISGSLWSQKNSLDYARILVAVTEWPGISIQMLALVLHEKPKGRRAQKRCMDLCNRGLLSRWKVGSVFRYRLSQEGARLMATMNRLKVEQILARTRLGQWASENGGGLSLRHETGVLGIVSSFLEAQLPVAAGWRDVEKFGSDGGIDPDAMVCLNIGPYGPGWYYLEYELTAVSTEQVTQKMRGYDSPRRPDGRPVLVACRHDRAELHFQQWAKDHAVPVATTTIELLSQHGTVSGHAIWSRNREWYAIG